MEITVQREKYEGVYQTRCYHCRSILTYQERDVHRNPGANRVVSRHGFYGYTGEVRCPNCHTWLPHYPVKNLMEDGKIVVYAVTEPTVRIPDNIREIGTEAFRKERLSEVILPQDLEIIGNAAFAETYLRSIVIPRKVREIGASTFAGCMYLQQIVIPENVHSIGSCAFVDCTGLQQIVFEGAPQIDPSAFQACSNVKKIIIKHRDFPQNPDIFRYFESLEEIECPDNLRGFAGSVLAGFQTRNWKAQGKCSFCGGEFTSGLFKKCSVCGKKKSY